jgi:hypothetical protein
VYALLWSFAGDAKLKVRSDLGDFIRSVTTVPLPPSTHIPIIDYEVSMAFEKNKWNLHTCWTFSVVSVWLKRAKGLEASSVSTFT